MSFPIFVYSLFRFHYDSLFMFYVGYAISNFTVAALISILTVSDDAPLQRIAAIIPLVYVGEISYGLYLWHFPIAYELTTQYHLSPLVRTLIVCTSSFALASASFYLIEKPALSLRGIRLAGTLGIFALATTIFCFLAGIWVFWQAEIASQFHDQRVAITAFGPTSIRRGESFNRQPDGSSAMWIQTATINRHDTRISIDGTPVPTSVSFYLLTASVPQSALSDLGEHKVLPVGPKSEPRSNEVKLQVLP